MNSQDQKLAAMTFASIYPLYLQKIEKKGRTESELQEIIEWLTGYNPEKQQEMIAKKVSFGEFFINIKVFLIAVFALGEYFFLLRRKKGK